MMVPAQDTWSKNPRVFLCDLDGKSVSTRPALSYPDFATHPIPPPARTTPTSLPSRAYWTQPLAASC